MDHEQVMDLHERRVERVQSAWEHALASSSDAPHIVAWEQIGWVSHGLDTAHFLDLVEADVVQSGRPLTFTDFIDHYNRMLVARAALFQSNYQLNLDEPLGEGGFGRVVKGTRKDNDETYAIKCSHKMKLSARAIQNLENEIRLWSRVQHSGQPRPNPLKLTPRLPSTQHHRRVLCCLPSRQASAAVSTRLSSRTKS